jgi:hypothetical protein
MVRKKNSTFQGVPSVDVARDASIFARTIANTAGDLALVLDKITGENGQAPVDHSGTAGLGCPLGLPLTNQTLNKSITLAAATSGAALGLYAVLVVPVYREPGVLLYRLDVDFSNVADTFFEIRDSSWAVSEAKEMRQTGPTGDGVIYDTGSILLPSGWSYIVVYRELSKDLFDVIRQWRIFPIYSAAASTGALPPTNTTTGSPYAASSTFTPSVMSANDIDTDMPTAIYGLDAYVLTRINRMINTAWEYVTGAKIPGNNAYQCTTTWDNSRASFTAEGLPVFPMFSTATSCVHRDAVIGAVKNNFLGALGTAAPTVGPTGWVRYPTAQAASITFARTRGYTPKFLNGATSKLACRVLAYDYDHGGSLGAWSATAQTAAGSKTSAFSQIGATRWWVAEMTAIPFLQETRSNFNILLSHTTPGVLADEIIVTGYTLAFVA